MGNARRNLIAWRAMIQPAREPQSDAFVFFGATGDLAYKKIFPALQSMVKRGEAALKIAATWRNAAM